MINLQWIHPTNLGTTWDLIKPGLEKVRIVGDHWRCEDVYLAVKTGHSNLHVGYDGEKYVGFIVTTPTESWDGMSLHIWATYSNAKDVNLLINELSQVKEWAKAINAKRITFSSKRAGWLRVAQKLGFRQSVINYEIGV